MPGRRCLRIVGGIAPRLFLHYHAFHEYVRSRGAHLPSGDLRNERAWTSLYRCLQSKQGTSTPPCCRRRRRQKQRRQRTQAKGPLPAFRFLHLLRPAHGRLDPQDKGKTTNRVTPVHALCSEGLHTLHARRLEPLLGMNSSLSVSPSTVVSALIASHFSPPLLLSPSLSPQLNMSRLCRLFFHLGCAGKPSLPAELPPSNDCCVVTGRPAWSQVAG